MLPCVRSVIDHRWRQNVVKTKKWHTSGRRVCHCCFDVLCDLLLNIPTATWNLFVLYDDQKGKRPIHIPASNRLTFSGAPNGNFRENICSEDDLRSRIFGAFVVKFLACLPLLDFRTSTKWYNYPFLTDFDPKKGHLEFSGAFSWLKFSRR